jgi:hypothetical protein
MNPHRGERLCSLGKAALSVLVEVEIDRLRFHPERANFEVVKSEATGFKI